MRAWFSIIFPVLLLSVLAIAGCSGPASSWTADRAVVAGQPAAAEKPAIAEPPSVTTERPPAALLKTGGYPLWFEFTRDGPRYIASPAEASLVDFAPWPLAIYCAGVLVRDSGMVLAINRFGFLELEPGAVKNDMTIYITCDTAGWDQYTVGSFFIHDEKPSVLLYRDDFFISPEAASPEFPVRSLGETPAPQNKSIPALENLLNDGLEINALRLGHDNLWYYRSVKYEEDGAERTDTERSSWHKTASLLLPGESVTQSEYRNALMPNTADGLPPVTRLVHAIIEGNLPDDNASLQNIILRIISPGFLFERSFAISPGADRDPAVFFGYLNDRPESPASAFAVSPDGRGIALVDNAVFTFDLPRLPRGFFYTGAGLAGNTLVAVWEEQEEFLTGAAGFMALSAENLFLNQFHSALDENFLK